MTRVKVAMAASVFVGGSLIGMILSVSSNVGALINSAYASSMSFDRVLAARSASEGPRGFDNELPGDRHRGSRGRALS
jgi:hypothetical protein